MILWEQTQHEAQQDGCWHSDNRAGRNITRRNKEHRQSQNQDPDKEMQRAANARKQKHLTWANYRIDQAPNEQNRNKSNHRHRQIMEVGHRLQVHSRGGEMRQHVARKVQKFTSAIP